MRTYFVHFYDDKAIPPSFYRRPVSRGYPLRIAHLPKIVFFAHRIPWKLSTWTVSDDVSGSRIGGEYSTRHEAIKAALEKLASVDEANFERTLRRVLIHTGGPVIKMPLMLL